MQCSAAAAEAARSSSSADLAGSELGDLERRSAFFAIELYTGNAETRSLEGILRGDLFADATVDIVMGSVIGANTSFDELVGCTLNGDWTIRATDDWGIDNGYIFEWTVTFSESIIPDCDDWID